MKSILLDGKDLAVFKGEILKQKQQAIRVSAAMPRPATYRRKLEKDASKKLDKVVIALDRKMTRLHRRLIRDDIDPSLFEKKMRIALRNAYMDAYALGSMSSGFVRADDISQRSSEDEMNWLKKVLKEENKHFTKFIDDMIFGVSRTKVKHRIKSYAEAIRSVFQSSRVLQMPDDSIFHWVLESGNPCADCRLLHRMSPFLRETLPTTPKSGSTRCLANCWCTLRIVKSKNQAELQKIKRRNRNSKYLLDRIEKNRARS